MPDFANPRFIEPVRLSDDTTVYGWIAVDYTGRHTFTCAGCVDPTDLGAVATTIAIPGTSATYLLTVDEADGSLTDCDTCGASTA